MEKEFSSAHEVKLTIKNDTKFPMEFERTWFDSGTVDPSFPFKNIAPGAESVILMGKGGALSQTGCSGYATYKFNGGELTVAFSNPKVGHNKVGCGNDGRSVWDRMGDHHYQPFSEEFVIKGIMVVANEICTGGKVNQASVTLTTR